MAIIVVNSTSSSGNKNAQSTWAWEHTTHADDTILIAVISIFDLTEADRPITGITWDAVNDFTPFDSPNHFYDDNTEHRTEIWYRLNPGASTTANIEVTTTGTCTDACGGAIGTSGVDTADPEDLSTTNNGAAGDPTITLGAAAAGSLVVGGLIIAENAAGKLVADQHNIHITDMNIFRYKLTCRFSFLVQLRNFLQIILY